MSIKVSSGISLSTNYFLRNFYTNNQKAAKTSGRSGYSNVELSYEDSRALNRAAKRLSKSDFGSDTDEKDDDLNKTSQAAIEAFVDTYNYTITSGKSSSDYETKRYVKQLNTLSKKHADELSDLGITVNSDGTLDLNKDLLKTANNSKARKLLSSDQEYPQKLVKLRHKGACCIFYVCRRRQGARESRGNGAVIAPVLLRKLNSVACQVRYAKLILRQDLGVF